MGRLVDVEGRVSLVAGTKGRMINEGDGLVNRETYERARIQHETARDPQVEMSEFHHGFQVMRMSDEEWAVSTSVKRGSRPTC
jgi:hypothetical protein